MQHLPGKRVRQPAAARWWWCALCSASPQQSEAAGLLLRLALLLLCAFLPPAAAAACGRRAVRWSTLQPADAAAPASLLCTCNTNSHLKAKLPSLHLRSLSSGNCQCNRKWQRAGGEETAKLGVSAFLQPASRFLSGGGGRSQNNFDPESGGSPRPQTNALGLSGN